MLQIGKIRIRPEIEKIIYYFHILLLVFFALIILKLVFAIDMLNFGFFWKLSVAVIIGDILAHTILNI